MSNISRQLKRFNRKQGRFPDDGEKGIGLIDLLNLPKNAHLTCPNCHAPWFHTVLDSRGVIVGCSKCGWDSVIRMQIPNVVQVCPECKCDEFAIMKMDDVIGIGCRRCNWQVEAKLENTTQSGILLVN